MARIVREVQPRFVFVENSPMLTSRGLGRVLGDLAAMGFDAEWGVVSAADVGAPHKRDRIWIMGYAHNDGQIAAEIIRGAIERSNGSQARSEQALESSGSSEQYAKLADTNMSQRERTELTQRSEQKHANAGTFSWWETERGLGRVAHGMADRMDRLKAIGNGQVPRVAATAWQLLSQRFND